MLEASQDVEDLARRAIGAAIEVHTLLGPGLLEAMYEEAMVHELGLRGISFHRQHLLDVQYKGIALGAARLDLLVEGKLILELKAVEAIAMIHVAQANAYLAMTGLELALILNFNVPSMNRGGIRRVIRSLHE
ncbi:MAG: GxxExxY protein [Deltaproteobacteria bacterium]|nr:GxxExxY protein [Deltaproteobacteria bacterium]